MDFALWLTGLTFGAFHSMAIEEGIARKVVLQRYEDAGNQHQFVAVRSVTERERKMWKYTNMDVADVNP